MEISQDTHRCRQCMDHLVATHCPPMFPAAVFKEKAFLSLFFVDHGPITHLIVYEIIISFTFAFVLACILFIVAHGSILLFLEGCFKKRNCFLSHLHMLLNRSLVQAFISRAYDKGMGCFYSFIMAHGSLFQTIVSNNLLFILKQQYYFIICCSILSTTGYADCIYLLILFS